MKKLTPKQLKFCREYIIDLNATQAAIRAGYSKKTATVIGYEHLTKPHIRHAISDLQRKHAEEAKVDAIFVLQEAARIALIDIGPAFTEDNTLKDIHDMPVDIRRAISSVKITELYSGDGEERELSGYTKEVKFWSKDKQIEILMRHLGLFLADNKQQGQTLAEVLGEIMDDRSAS